MAVKKKGRWIQESRSQPDEEARYGRQFDEPGHWVREKAFMKK